MNPHTEHPDEGNDPSGGNAGPPEGHETGQNTGQKTGTNTGQEAGQTAGQAAGPSAGRPADQPADTSATLPLDTSATLPLDFSAGGGAGTPPPPPPPPPYYGPTPPPAGSQPQNFFDWIRSQGVYRGRERWVGGVASGIAQRLGVDPLIVRGILIVLTVFAGVGVLLYGIAWALLPEPDGRIHVQEAAAGRWSAGMTGALITTIIGFPSLGTGIWGWDRYGFGAFVWTVFWVGGAIYLIYYLTQRNKSRNGVPLMSSSPQSGGPANPDYPPNPATPAHRHAGNASTPVPPSTSTAPFATTGYGASATLPRYGESTVPGPGWGTPPPAGPTPPPGAATSRCRAADPSRRPRTGTSAPAPPPSRSPPDSPCWWAAASRPSTSRT